MFGAAWLREGTACVKNEKAISVRELPTSYSPEHQANHSFLFSGSSEGVEFYFYIPLYTYIGGRWYIIYKRIYRVTFHCVGEKEGGENEEEKLL